ncbi:MAG: type II CAAX endopeptidase family protein [Acidimicrobiales bacterium]|nr:type II CAAX endopeptidase family protein [Acidimicrobiales bacterium]
MERPMNPEVVGTSRPPAAWGFGHVGAGLVVGMLATVVVMGIAAAVLGADAAEDPSLAVGALVQGALYLGLVGVPVWLVMFRGVRWSDFGWLGSGPRRRVLDACQGLAIGVFAQLVAVPALYAPILLFTDELDVSGPARELVDQANGLGIALLVLMVVVMAPITEELFFRGLALRAMEARMPRRLALAASALLFGLTHFQLLQLPALVMIGLVCGWLAQRDKRLGRAVWTHVGFNATTTFILLLG